MENHRGRKTGLLKTFRLRRNGEGYRTGVPFCGKGHEQCGKGRKEVPGQKGEYANLPKEGIIERSRMPRRRDYPARV